MVRDRSATVVRCYYYWCIVVEFFNSMSDMVDGVMFLDMEEITQKLKNENLISSEDYALINGVSISKERRRKAVFLVHAMYRTISTITPKTLAAIKNVVVSHENSKLGRMFEKIEENG